MDMLMVSDVVRLYGFVVWLLVMAIMWALDDPERRHRIRRERENRRFWREWERRRRRG